MEYIVTSDQPFEEIEALTIATLERQGLVIRRTFSLHSAVVGRPAASKRASGNPGYSILMLHGAGVQGRPLGSLTLYRRGERTVIIPALTSPADADVEADLVAALVLGDLEFCMEVAGAERCIEPKKKDEIGGSGQ